jgi:arylsulfatase A-like enzyme
VLSLLLVLAGACSPRELSLEAARLPLGLRLSTARLDVHETPEVQGVQEVLWVSAGLAGIAVELAQEDGKTSRIGDRQVVRWRLPVPPAPPSAGDELPELLDLDLPRMEVGEKRGNGYWIEDGHLVIIHGASKELPETLRLAYTVHAARLAGTGHAAGVAPADMLLVRARRGDFSAEALALPSSATLTLTLPPVPAGRLEGVFAAVLPEPDGVGPEVVVSAGGAELFRGVVGSGERGGTLLGTSFEPWVGLPPSDEPSEVSIEVRGPPGELVLFEAPAWSRPRSWTDGDNVLLVVVDGLRADRLAIHGNRRKLTPSLDLFARGALSYDEAWSTSSFTLSSVASLLTSTHGTEHQATLPDRRLGPGVETLAERFSAAGYRTAAFTEGGFVSPPFGLDRGFATFDGTSDGAAATVDRAVAFIERAGAGPWFVLVHTYALHAPYEPPADAKASVERRFPDALHGLPPDPRALAKQIAKAGGMPPDALALLQGLYDESVRFADAELGRLFDELRRLKLYEDAVICVTADHGEEFGEHGFLGHADTLYPEVLHVPLLLKLARGERANTTFADPVSLIDLAPTLLTVAGEERQLAGSGFDGVSLVGGRDPTPVFAQRDAAEVELLAAMRREEFVLIHGEYAHPRRAQQPELYDLGKDPGALKSLGRSEKMGLQEMKNRMELVEERFGTARTEASEVYLDPEQAVRLERFR